MEAKELRIGNWYERNDYSKHQITIDDLVYLSKGEDIKRIRPIPLTEEILLKCGFKKDGSSDYFTEEYEGVYFAFSKSQSKFNISSDYDGLITISIPKYFHQLQNLYWCLCKEELEVNL